MFYRLYRYAAFIAFILCILSLTLAPTATHAKKNHKYASIVMDADTGVILHQSRANKSLHPASLTKIMTLMLLFEEIERGNIRMRDRIRISNHAASMVPSKIGLKPGSTIRVKDAIPALSIKSANDIAVAVAEHIGGTEATFARMMTRRAHEIGMKKTYFKNASGLHNKYQVSTARDMAKLARFFINAYPHHYRHFAKKRFSYHGKTYKTHNKLMNTYKGMDGMKTGYIAKSGFNLVASAVRGNRRIIGVVFGGRTSKSRNAHMKMLLDKGFGRAGRMVMASNTFKAPKPERKPNILVALETLNNIATAAGNSSTVSEQKWASLSPSLQDEMFSRMIGEGDIDPSLRSRIETGLIAIAAHQGQKQNYVKSTTLTRHYTKPKRKLKQNWTIQIGAYKSRAQAEQVLHAKRNILPINLQTRNAHIAPLKTKDGWLFRSRIGGYEKMAALQACRVLRDCITIPPK